MRIREKHLPMRSWTRVSREADKTMLTCSLGRHWRWVHRVNGWLVPVSRTKSDVTGLGKGSRRSRNYRATAPNGRHPNRGFRPLRTTELRLRRDLEHDTATIPITSSTAVVGSTIDFAVSVEYQNPWHSHSPCQPP